MTTQCPRCLFDSSIAKMREKQCEYCDLHDQLEKNAPDWRPVLNKIKRIKGKYSCLIGISGGLDSSTLLFLAVRYWKLRPLVIHFNNGWNVPAATHNMNALVDALNVDMIEYKVNKGEYDALNHSFLLSGTPDCDSPNDIAMTKLMYQTADKYGIKWIVNGHDFRSEGSTPADWTRMDAKYIQDVYKRYTGRELKNYPLFTFCDQIYYAFKGIKQVRPFHFKEVYDMRAQVERKMKVTIGFQEYGSKHAENLYTEYVGAYLLPRKFGINKRRVYLSAQVRSGVISKEDALKVVATAPEFDLSRIPLSISSVQSPVTSRDHFAQYNFKKYRIVIWCLMKLNVVPYTMYRKYCF